MKENVDILKEETRNGLIGNHQLKIIATKMGGQVHGVYVQKHRETILYKKNVDGVSRMIAILKEKTIGLAVADKNIGH